MYRTAAVFVVLMLFAACNHGEGVGMEWNPDVSKQTSMEDLKVTWLGTDTAIHKRKEVTIDAARGISVYIEMVDAEGLVTDSCTGSAEMSEEDYQTVLAQVNAADLGNYVPPAEGDENCIPAAGILGFAFEYAYSDGVDVVAVEFETGTCQIEDSIENITIVVGGMADTYVTDCTDETVLGGGDDDGIDIVGASTTVE